MLVPSQLLKLKSARCSTWHFFETGLLRKCLFSVFLGNVFPKIYSEGTPYWMSLKIQCTLEFFLMADNYVLWSNKKKINHKWSCMVVVCDLGHIPKHKNWTKMFRLFMPKSYKDNALICYHILFAFCFFGSTAAWTRAFKLSYIHRPFLSFHFESLSH